MRIGKGPQAFGARDYPAGISDAITYVGHATLLFELAGARVLTDPLLRERVLHIRWRAPAPALQELSRLDAVLISHAHHDHLDPRSLRMLDPQCPVVAPGGCGRILRRAGVHQAIEVAAGDRVPVGDISVEAVAAVHDGRRYPVGPELPSLGYLLEGPPGVYFAGDTDIFPEMAELAGRVEVAAVPVSGWGPDDPPGHLDPERAARAVALIEPRIVIPIHWGTLYSVGNRRRRDPFRPVYAFRREIARFAPSVEVRVLAPGERLTLNGN